MNLRSDGRQRNDYRSYAISASSSSSSTKDNGPLVQCHGSSRVTLCSGGDTDILCSIRAELVSPSVYRPDDGLLSLSIHYLPSSAKNRRRRPPNSSIEMELGNSLQTLICNPMMKYLESGLLGELLCVWKGRYVWKLNIDFLIFASCGNLLDLCSIALRTAFHQTILPQIQTIPHAITSSSSSSSEQKQQQQQPHNHRRRRVTDELFINANLPSNSRLISNNNAIHLCPIVITIYLIPVSANHTTTSSSSSSSSSGKSPKSSSSSSSSSRHSKNNNNNNTILLPLLDPTPEEEQCAMARIAVAVDIHGDICGIQMYHHNHHHHHNTSNTGMMTLSLLSNDVTSMAIQASKYIYQTMFHDDNDNNNNSSMMVGTLGGDGNDDDDLLISPLEFQ